MEPEILTKGSLLARGIFAVIIGILCFTLPIAIEAVIAYIIGIFLLIISLMTAGMSLSSEQKGRWPIMILALIGVIIAILTFISPFSMIVALTILIAAWAIITGITELFIAFSMKDLPFRALLGVNGFIGVLFGILIVFCTYPNSRVINTYHTTRYLLPGIRYHQYYCRSDDEERRDGLRILTIQIYSFFMHNR